MGYISKVTGGFAFSRPLTHLEIKRLDETVPTLTDGEWGWPYRLDRSTRRCR